jgi:hypothetical protein
MEWTDRLEETLKLAESRSLATASLWEHDETQFGEPLLTYLSLIDVQFVPFYTRLLRLWDMGHAVHQGEAVTEIINKYKITPETEDLILCYNETTGTDELGLLDLLDPKKRPQVPPAAVTSSPVLPESIPIERRCLSCNGTGALRLADKSLRICFFCGGKGETPTTASKETSKEIAAMWCRCGNRSGKQTMRTFGERPAEYCECDDCGGVRWSQS